MYSSAEENWFQLEDSVFMTSDLKSIPLSSSSLLKKSETFLRMKFIFRENLFDIDKDSKNWDYNLQIFLKYHSSFYFSVFHTKANKNK